MKFAQRPSPLSSASETVSGGRGMFWNCGKARVAETGEEGCGQKLAGLEEDHKGLRAQFKGLGLERKALGSNHQRAVLGRVMRWDLRCKELTLGAGNGGPLQSRPLFAQKPRKRLSPPARLTTKRSPSPGCPQKPLQNLSPPHPSREPLHSLSGPEAPAIAASFSPLLPVPPATRWLQRSNLQGLPTGAGGARSLSSERQGRQDHSSSGTPAGHQALSWGGNRNRASWVPGYRGSPSGGLQPPPSLIWICSHEFSQGRGSLPWACHRDSVWCPGSQGARQ